MDENRFEGAAREIGGDIKGTVGDLTGDTKMQAEGTVDQVVGTAQRAYGKVKDTVTNQAGGLGSAVVDQLDETSAFLGDAVAERPLTSLLVAGAIGYVLGDADGAPLTHFYCGRAGCGECTPRGLRSAPGNGPLAPCQ